MMINENFFLQKMNGISPDCYLYKFIPLKFLFLIVKDKKIRVNQVASWDDPYENFFLKSDFTTYLTPYKTNVKVATEEIVKRVYGLSCTLKEESDAMWRIYSTNPKDSPTVWDLKDTAVRIKIKANNLFHIFYTDDSCMATTCMNKIRYLENKEMESWIQGHQTNLDMNIFPQIVEDSLFIKRKAFEHEQEVRIIITRPTNTSEQKFIEYPIKDISVLESFTLDPRLKPDQYNMISKELQELGIVETKITKSDLYNLPDFVSIKI